MIKGKTKKWEKIGEKYIFPQFVRYMKQINFEKGGGDFGKIYTPGERRKERK